MRRIPYGVLIVGLVLLSVMGTGCLGGRSQEGGAQQAETAVATEAPATTAPLSPVETPAATLPPALAMLSLVAPESVSVGTLFPVTVELVGVTSLREALVEVPIPILYLQVADDDLAVAGVQVLPGDLPAGAQVVRNEVGADGTVVYQVSGLGASTGLSRTLFTMHLQAVAPGVADLSVRQVALTAEDGTPLTVQMQTVLLEVLAAGATPEPVATVLPPATVVPVTPTVGAVQGIYLRVQPGQNLFRLAQTYGSTVDQVAAANGITDVNRLPAGMVLRIPVQPPAGLGQAAYLVAPGDTLYSVSRFFGLTVEALAAQNNLPAPYAIQAGRWIIVRP
jgi:LysM repeat protein